MWPRRNANGQWMNEDGSPAEAPSTSQPFSLFNPATWLSGLQSGVSNFFGGLFNFGNIFTIGLLAIGAYFLAKNDTVKEWLNEMIEKLPPEWQAMISGFTNMLRLKDVAPEGLDRFIEGLTAEQAREKLPKLPVGAIPTEIMNIIAKDQTNWDLFRNTVKEANGGTITANAFSKPHVITALLTRCGPMVRDIITASRTSTGNGGAMVQQIMSSVRGLINDPTQLATMLNDTNRLETMRTVAAISPIPFSPESLSNFVRTVGMTEAGQPTDAFRTFLTAMVTNTSATGMSTALVTFLTSPEVAANTSAAASFQALAQSVNLSTITDPTQRQLVQLLKYHAEPTLTLIKTLGQEKAAQLMTLLSAPAQTNEQRAQSTQALTAFVLAEIPAFKTFADTPGLIESLPAGDLRNGLSQLHGMSAQAVEAGRTMIERGVNPVTLANSFVAHDESGAPLRNNQNGPLLTLQPLLTPEGRAQIRTAGVKNVALVANENMPLITERNLNALIGFCETIGTNPNNTRVNGARTGKVMAAIQDMMLNNSSENFKNLTAQELAGFFGDAGNNRAFTTLLNTLQVPAGTQGAAQINALKRAWGGEFNGKTESVGNVLATADGAQFVLDELNGRHNRTWMATGQNGSFLGMSATEWQRSWNGLFVSSVRENSDALTLLASAFPTQTARQAPQRPAH